jgi:hypothetical protein
MTRIQKQYEDETGQDATYFMNALTTYHTLKYVEWLEKKIESLTNDRSDMPCGDCNKLLPENLICDNPNCVRNWLKSHPYNY